MSSNPENETEIERGAKTHFRTAIGFGVAGVLLFGSSYYGIFPAVSEKGWRFVEGLGGVIALMVSVGICIYAATEGQDP